jgi:peptidoglycan/LPS O-acetylase OafA/YrhL
MREGSPSTSRRRYFTAVEGMRGFAALCVLGGHGLFFDGGTGDALYEIGSWVATFGVAVFFAISGFLLYRPFVAARGTGQTVRSLTPAYLLRRAVRIFPGYWVALTGVAIWLGLSAVFSGHWWAYYGLLQVYSRAWATDGLDPAWTLCVELSFYLALPLIAALLARRGVGSGRAGGMRWELVVVLGLGAVSLVWRSVVGADASTTYLANNLLGTFSWFCGGMLLAGIQVDPSAAPRLVRRALARPALCWPLAAALFALLPLGVIRDLALPLAPTIWLEMIVFAIATTCFMGPAVLGEPARVVNLSLANRALVFTGMVSYGVYLWHVPVMTQLLKSDVVAESPSPVLVLIVLTLAVSLAIGAASWYLVERPLMRRVRSVKAYGRIRRRRAPEAPRPVLLSAPSRDAPGA